MRRAVTSFSEHLLRADLPGLPADRRSATAVFVADRVGSIGGPARLGVSTVAVVVHGLARLPLLGRRAVAALVARPLPLLGEYPRLVRSLAYAHVWERWPDTRVDGRPGQRQEAA